MKSKHELQVDHLFEIYDFMSEFKKLRIEAEYEVGMLIVSLKDADTSLEDTDENYRLVESCKNNFEVLKQNISAFENAIVGGRSYPEKDNHIIKCEKIISLSDRWIEDIDKIIAKTKPMYTEKQQNNMVI